MIKTEEVKKEISKGEHLALKSDIWGVPEEIKNPIMGDKDCMQILGTCKYGQRLGSSD